ncbi:putative mucin TcMUCI [Trypanosoma cruzi]|nr:putative mucin TcMUCI [Trypanosoma cruzi]
MTTCRPLCALLVLALCCCPSVCVTANGNKHKNTTTTTTTRTTRVPPLLRKIDGSPSSPAWVYAPLVLAVSVLAYSSLC